MPNNNGYPTPIHKVSDQALSLLGQPSRTKKKWWSTKSDKYIGFLGFTLRSKMLETTAECVRKEERLRINPSCLHFQSTDLSLNVDPPRWRSLECIISVHMISPLADDTSKCHETCHKLQYLERKGYTLGLEKMGQDNFEASNGWLERFKARRNIAFKRLHGEAGSVDANSVATWKGGIIPSLLAKYSPQDILNADETGLFYKLLPNQTMTIRGEKCEGGKKSKERITVLVCCNMDGSEKLPLLYIGKYRRPRCFRGMNIPSNYHFNKKAWMTGAIFTDWLKKLDQIFKRRERKILLIYLYNCLILSNIEIRFLPALTTSALQPCDMGIIKALKDQYRKRMIMYLLTCMEEKKMLKYIYSLQLAG
ncbi:TIGD4 [Cordylochernes scorpioides]|uniref:TIGD4 n=1 Tax=Cordylochernes scorpioides TaxID=51811 RepID=A0ABY6L6Y3_9ARAC|nr:TIGD4 [Cordylochernes scorpioides]